MAGFSVGDLYLPQGGTTVNTPYDESGSTDVKVQDFLQLMIAQLSNQDFTNPVDDTQYVTQLAQFATMQQMQELAQYSKSNYAMSLVGKVATVASYSLGGNINKDVGVIEKISLVNNEYTVTVKGKSYKLNQIMSVGDGSVNADKDTNLTPILLKRRPTDAAIRWDPITNNADDAKNFSYSVFISENDKFDSLEEVKAGKNVGEVDRGEDLTLDFNGLEPGKTYYVNIVARNSAGKESVYKKLVFETPKD